MLIEPSPLTGFEISESQLLARIVALGHKTAEGEADVESYQRWHGLSPDGVIGPVTAHHMGQRRCALPDIIPLGTEAKACGWNFKQVPIAQRLSLAQLSKNEIVEVWYAACARWNNVCGITLQISDDFASANIYANSGNIDGGGGVLAWSYLPCNSGQNERMEQLFDDREQWDYDMLLEVATHEIGHAIGIPHLPIGNIMTAHAMGYDKLGPQDIAEAVERYGTNTEPVPPTPPPDPSSARLTGAVAGVPWAFIGFKLE